MQKNSKWITAVRLHQIEIDRFQNAKPLKIANFRPGLNVIRMPDPEAAHELAAFLQQCFDPPQNESIEFASWLELDNETVKLMGRNRNGTLRAVNQKGTASRAKELEKALSDLPDLGYRALFTDHLLPQRFLQACLSDKQIRDLMVSRKSIRTAGATQVSANSLNLPSTSEHLECISVASERLRQSKSSPAANLDKYVGLMKEEREQSSRLHQLQEEMQRLRLRQQLIQTTMSIWSQHEELQRLAHDETAEQELDRLVEVNDSLQEIDRQIDRCQRKLNKAHKQLKQYGKPEDLTRLHQCASKAEQAQEYAQRLSEIKSGKRLSDIEIVPDKIKRSSRDVLQRLRPFALDLKRCRQELQSLPTDSPNQQVAESSPHVFDSIAAADLRDQVKQLQQECEQLLTSQALPTTVSIMISVLIALGSILLLLSLFWAGSSLTIFACGVAALLGGLLLGLLVRQTPPETIARYRKQINLLSAEIANLEHSPDPLDAHLESIRCEDKLQAKANYDVARHNWREALQAQSLPPNLSPKQLLLRLKRPRKINPSSGASPGLTPSVQVESDRISAWLDEWKRRCCETLNLPVDGAFDLELLARQVKERNLAARRSQEKVQEKAAQVTERTAQIDHQLEDLAKQRKRMLASVNVGTVKELETAIRQQRTRIGQDARRETLEHEIEERLKNCHDPTTCRELLRDATSDFLKEELSHLETDVSKVFAAINKTEASLGDIVHERSQTLDVWDEHREQLQRQIDRNYIERHSKALIVQLILTANLPTQQRRVSYLQSPFLRETTDLFRRSSRWHDVQVYHSQRHSNLYLKHRNLRTFVTNLPDDVAQHLGFCCDLD